MPRPRPIDWLVAATVGAVAQLETWLTEGMEPKAQYALVALAVCVPLIWRRVAPRAALLAVFVPLFAMRVAGDPLDAAYIMLVLLVAFSALGSFCERRRAVGGFLAGVLLLGGLLVVERLDGGGSDWGAAAQDFVFLVGIFGVVFALAVVVRERSAQAGALEERAERLERDREDERHRAVSEERARIARELHDVVAHSVSVIAVQSGSLRHRLRHQPDAAVELLAIEQTAREALTEMRRMVGLLRFEADDGTLSPQPGVAQLERLVDRVRAAGVPVELSFTGDRRDLPGGLDLAVYRIVQEALTNVRKHGASAPTRVDVSFGPGGLELDVRDEGPGATSDPGNSGGHGLIGMRERVALYGGTLRIGTEGAGGFRVRVSLPLPGA